MTRDGSSDLGMVHVTLILNLMAASCTAMTIQDDDEGEGGVLLLSGMICFDGQDDHVVVQSLILYGTARRAWSSNSWAASA